MTRLNNRYACVACHHGPGGLPSTIGVFDYHCKKENTQTLSILLDGDGRLEDQKRFRSRERDGPEQVSVVKDTTGGCVVDPFPSLPVEESVIAMAISDKGTTASTTRISFPLATERFLRAFCVATCSQNRRGGQTITLIYKA